MPTSRIPATGIPGSRLLAFGGIVGSTTLGAAIASTPATLRIENGTGACGPLGTWAMLVAISFFPMGMAVLVLRRARIGFAALGNRDSLAPLLTIIVWLTATLLSLLALGALLRARTHHRALGGVVLAVVAVAASVVLGVITIRLAAIMRRLPRSLLGALGIAAGAGLGFFAAFARAQIAHSGPFLPSTESAMLVDGAAFAVSALVASGSPLAPRRSLALVGPPLAVVILLLGVSSLRSCPRAFDTLGGEAPLFSKLAELVAPH
jgi:hypothetical protein